MASSVGGSAVGLGLETLDQSIGKVVDFGAKLNAFFGESHNLIPHMAWEKYFSSAFGLSTDQYRFVLALFLSVLAGVGLHFIRGRTARHLYSLLTGVFLVYYPFGSGVQHVVLPSLLTYLGMLVVPKYCGYVAWAVCFPYLIYLHVTNASGMSWNQGELDFTGGEMVLVLKLVSLAMCLQDHLQKHPLSNYQISHIITRAPGVLEYCSFLFGLGNLLGGPTLEYRDYKEFIEEKGVWSPKAVKPVPSPWLPGLLLFAEALAFMGVYMIMIGGWSMNALKETWYLKLPVPMKLLCMIVIGNVYQTRYYFAWKLSEASLTFAGLNFAAWDEKGRPKWGRYCNARLRGVLLNDSGRLVPNHWNICTGNFLRRYVYDRIVPRNGKANFGHLMVTQLVSGIWHGLYPGYGMFFASSALWIYSATALYKLESNWPFKHSPVWRVVKIFWTQLILEYIAMPFVVLDFQESWKVWKQVLFIPHLTMFAVILASMLFAPKHVSKSREKGGERKPAAPLPGVSLTDNVAGAGGQQHPHKQD